MRSAHVVSELDSHPSNSAGKKSKRKLRLYSRILSMRRANNLSSIAVTLFAVAVTVPLVCAQSLNSPPMLDWCRKLPRPQYRHLERVPSADPWFEVYRIAAGVFAIYEPHQSEEAISFLILGERGAVMFDTGLGIGDIKRVVLALTSLPIVVLNSHTHDDHVGDNWEFSEIYGMDTDFTRFNTKGSSADAQDELAPGSICGHLPVGFDAKS